MCIGTSEFSIRVTVTLTPFMCHLWNSLLNECCLSGGVIPVIAVFWSHSSFEKAFEHSLRNPQLSNLTSNAHHRFCALCKRCRSFFQNICDCWDQDRLGYQKSDHRRLHHRQQELGRYPCPQVLVLRLRWKAVAYLMLVESEKTFLVGLIWYMALQENGAAILLGKLVIGITISLISGCNQL